ncbi:hypothetical protein [Zoogloea sp.]
MIGQAMADFVLPEDRASTERESARGMAGHPGSGSTNRYRH